MNRLKAIRLFLKLVWRKSGYLPAEVDTRIDASTAWSVSRGIWLED